MTAQNIQFRGIRRSPSDITGQDGDLLDCVNLVHEDGELKPIAMPERSNITVPVRNNTPYILAHIHNTTDGAMFVFVWKQDNGDDMLVVQDADNITKLSRVAYDSLGQSVKWVQSVGNTLVIGTDKSIHYALYKNNEYKWLGDSLPRPVIDFQLENGDILVQSEPTPNTLHANESEVSDGLHLCIPDTYNPTPSNVGMYIWEYQNRSNNTSAMGVRDNVIGKITNILAKAKENNQFIYPFFVRYALRLYDGSYVCQSQPILLLPSSNKVPIMATINYWGDIYHNTTAHTYELKCNIYTYGLPSRLKYIVKDFVNVDNDEMLDINDWSDIVKGVDIFCSSQISQINQKQLEHDDVFDINFYGYQRQFSGGVPPINRFGYSYDLNRKTSLSQELVAYYNEHDPGGLVSYLAIPSKVEDDYIEELSGTGLFYLVKSYKLKQYNDLKNNDTYLDDEVEIDTLKSIESAKTLVDEYIGRSRITAEIGHTYNKRLILGNLTTELPLWYPMTELSDSSKSSLFKLYFVIEKNSKTIVVPSSDTQVRLWNNRFGHYIYYPDPDCKSVFVVAQVTWNTQHGVVIPMYANIPMEEHPTLNGSYAIMPHLESLVNALNDGEFDAQIGTPPEGWTPIPSENRYYPMRNSIAMAEVANPFTWQAENFKEVGNGSVIDLAPNMMEVSSGQWGQYPLYVFSTDGIYAFGINNDGTLGAMSPVSSDVLLIPQGMGKPSLIQANQMLVFTTSRGVMGLQGTQARPLSLVMDGRHFNAKDDLGLDVLYDSGAFKSIVNETYDTKPFHDFVLNGFLAYDYAHNRVLVLNDDSKYQYVLSLDSGLWSRQVTYRNLDMIQTNNPTAQQSSSRGSRSSSGRTLKTIDVTKISAAANNYTEMYLQGNDNRLYVTQNVTEENNNPLYQYGYFVSRPVRFGTDEFKTITRLLHRYTHYAPNSSVKLAMYGSRDGVNYGRINTLRGMSWKYYIFVVYTYLKPNERYSYMAVDFEPRLTNKLR